MMAPETGPKTTLNLGNPSENHCCCIQEMKDVMEGLLDEGARDEASPAGERLIELVGYNRIMRPFRLVRFVLLIQNIGELLIFSSCDLCNANGRAPDRARRLQLQHAPFPPGT